ncbi:hypothetical protein Ancab_012669, partial [Ancistrocladus abbreviatus]
ASEGEAVCYNPDDQFQKSKQKKRSNTVKQRRKKAGVKQSKRSRNTELKEVSKS